MTTLSAQSEGAVSSRDEEWKQRQEATRDVNKLLYEVHRWTDSALEMAEDEPERQRAAAILAQVATARAIAALAAAVQQLGAVTNRQNQSRRPAQSPTGRVHPGTDDLR